MGIVYLGYDPLLDRKVAIKVMPPKKLAQKSAVQRFLREARVSARLDHPNIIKLYDVGEEEGIYHLVMEYAPGRTLRDIIESRSGVSRIDVSAMLDIFLQVLHAIAYAHNLKITHRDIKPENIMVSPKGQAKVMDFGLAFLEGRHSLTEAGAVMGTLAYFAPEQAKGDPIDHRADIYALGMTLYESLTNALPFEASSASEMIQKHLTAPPILPHHFNPKIPLPVENIILKSLRKLPEERYQSVDEMIEEFEAILGLAARPKPALKLPKPKAAAPAPDPVDADAGLNAEIQPSAQQPAAEPQSGDTPAAPEPQGQTPQPPQAQASAPAPELQSDLSAASFMEAGARGIPGYYPPPLNLSPAFISKLKQELKSGSAPHISREEEWGKYQQFVARVKKDEDLLAQLDEVDEAQILCAKCGSINTSDKKYCDECGALLSPSTYISSREASAYGELGVRLYEKGKLDDALLALDQAIERDGNFADALYYKGRILMEMEKSDAAFEIFQKILQTYPQEGRVYVKLAEIYRSQQKKEEAITAYREALRYDPNNIEARCQLGFLYFQQQDMDRAIMEYERVLTLDGGNLEALRQLGIIYSAQNKVEQAIAKFEALLRLSPNEEQVLQWLGDLYASQNKLQSAEKFYHSALNLNPNSAGIHVQLSSIYEKQRREDLAMQELRSAVLLERGNVDARISLSHMYLKHGKIKAAAEELEEVAVLHPQEVKIHRQLGDLYLEMRQLDKALEHYEKSVNLEPGSAEVHDKLGQIYLKKDYNALSISEYQKAVQLEPHNPGYHEDLGMAYYLQKDYDAAVLEIKKAAALDSQNLDYHKALGIMYYEKGALEESIKILKKILEINPEEPQAHTILGKIYARQNLFNMAILEFSKALEVEPRSVSLHIQIGKIYNKLGKIPEAIEAFKHAIALTSGQAADEPRLILIKSYTNLGKMYLDSQKFAPALEVLHSAEQVNPSDPKILHYLGLAYTAIKNFKLALDYLTQAVMLEPQNADIIADIGRLHYLKGSQPLALKAYRTALAIAPERGDFYAAVAEFLCQEDKPQEALELLDNGLNTARNALDKIYAARGQALAAQKRWREAEASYRKAVEAAPGIAAYHQALGDILDKSGQFAAAAAELASALSLETDDKTKRSIKQVLDRVQRKV